MQRVHLDDIVSHVQKHEEWTVLNLPAIAMKSEVFTLSNGKVIKRGRGEALNPSLESLESLAKTKLSMGNYNFSAQYQQEPIPESGNIINWDWFKPFTTLPPADGQRTQIIQSWDTAMKAHDGSDYSACVTIKAIGTRYFVLDVFRERLDFPSLKKKIIQMQEQFAADAVLIEDKGSGTSMLQQLSAEYFPAIAYEPEGCKADRLVAQSAHIEAGQVYLLQDADWLDDLHAEVVSFPYGRNDDQIDALSQALHWLEDPFISILDVL